MKLKKFIAILLTTITAACIAVGFSGCKKDEGRFTVKISENTAETPFYEIPPASSSPQEFYYYQEFEDYILGDFKEVNSNAFYYIEPFIEFDDDIDERIYGWSFGVYSETVNNRDLIIENFTFYDEELGGWVKDYYGDELPPTGVVDYSVSLTFIFPTLETKPTGRELVMEFGMYSSSEWIFDKFINLYIGESCIGTCLYHEGSEVPQNWFANYFAHKLNVENV